MGALVSSKWTFTVPVAATVQVFPGVVPSSHARPQTARETRSVGLAVRVTLAVAQLVQAPWVFSNSHTCVVGARAVGAAVDLPVSVDHGPELEARARDRKRGGGRRTRERRGRRATAPRRCRPRSGWCANDGRTTCSFAQGSCDPGDSTRGRHGCRGHRAVVPFGHRHHVLARGRDCHARVARLDVLRRRGHEPVAGLRRHPQRRTRT